VGAWIAAGIVVVIVTASVWKEIYGGHAYQTAPLYAAGPSQDIVPAEPRLKHIRVETSLDHRFAEQRDALYYIDVD